MITILVWLAIGASWGFSPLLTVTLALAAAPILRPAGNLLMCLLVPKEILADDRSENVGGNVAALWSATLLLTATPESWTMFWPIAIGLYFATMTLPGLMKGRLQVTEKSIRPWALFGLLSQSLWFLPSAKVSDQFNAIFS